MDAPTALHTEIVVGLSSGVTCVFYTCLLPENNCPQTVTSGLREVLLLLSRENPGSNLAAEGWLRKLRHFVGTNQHLTASET